ncbi:hypothetical protein IWZ01DRAFT_540261 [Phyllosticta capitalensis]
MAYQCKDMDDVLAAVQYQIQTSAQGLIPEEVVCRLQLPLNANLDYPRVKAEERPSVGQDETPIPPKAADGGPIDADPCPGYSVAAALSNFYDQKEKANYQKVVAKAVVGAIQYADGFRWTVRRTKDTLSNDGLRFSYICRDSEQNQNASIKLKKESSRAEGADPIATARDFYDCKGGIKLLFSIKDLCIDVFYHHLPVHDHADQLDKQRKEQREAMKASDTPPAPPPGDMATATDFPFPYPMPQVNPQPEATAEPPKKKRGPRKKKADSSTLQTNGNAFASQGTQNLELLADAANANMYSGYPFMFDQPQYGAFDEQPTSNGESTTQKRSRSRTGCLTCREKRIKCDEKQPTCANCLKSRDTRICQWPSQESNNGKPKGTKKTKKAPATSTAARSTSNSNSSSKAPKQQKQKQPPQKQQPAKLTKQRAGTKSAASPTKKRKSAAAEPFEPAASRAKPSPSKRSKKAKA